MHWRGHSLSMLPHITWSGLLLDSVVLRLLGLGRLLLLLPVHNRSRRSHATTLLH